MSHDDHCSKLKRVCDCMSDFCNESSNFTSSLTTAEVRYQTQIGAMIYTISILLMFSFVIVLLMFRSIKSSAGTVEMDSLLDAMRFREELDMRERQLRRLQRAKIKVSAWLKRTNNGLTEWKKSPAPVPRARHSNSTSSEIPEIVITDEGPAAMISRCRTPALSLIFNFSEPEESRRGRPSICSSKDGTLSHGSFSLDLDIPPHPLDTHTIDEE